MKLRIVLAALLALAATVCSEASLAQAQLYFSVSSGTPAWDDGITPNWSSVSGGPYNSPWVDGNDAHLEGTGGSVDVNGAIGSAAGIFFDIGGYSLNPDPVNGGALAFLGSDGITTATGVAAAINVPLTLGSSQTWTTGSGGTLTVGGGITNGGNLLTIAGAGQTIINGSLGNGNGLTMQGPGTLVLNGANSYSGTTTLASGTLDLDNAAAVGTSRLVITGGTIDNTSGSALTVTPSNMTWNTGFTFLGSSNLNLSGGSIANLTAPVTVNVANGILSVADGLGTTLSTAGITKLGNGILALTSSANNAYSFSGTTSITGGALEMPSTGISTKTYIVLNGGVEQIYNKNANAYTLNTTFRSTASSGDIEWSSTASGGFAARGGPLTVNLGGFPNPAVWGSTAGFLGNGESLLFGTSDSNALVNFQGKINLNGAQRTVYVNAGQSGSIAELSGVISDSVAGSHGGIYKDGPGSLILAGANTFTGPTEVHAGELYLNNNSAVGASDAITVDSGATLGGTSNLTSKNPTVTIAAGGGLEGGQSGTGSLTLPNATFSGSGTFTVPATLPSLYFNQSGSVGLTVGTLNTGGGSAGSVVNISGSLYPTFQGTTPTTAHVIQYTTLGGSGYNFTLGSVNASAPLGYGGFSLVNNAAQKSVDISYYANYAIWTGATSGIITDPGNFNLSSTGGSLTYADGYDLYFDDSAGSANSSITLSATYNGTGNISPRTLYFNNNSVNYTINGSGVYPQNSELGDIISSPTFVMAGSGTVTLTGRNNLGTIYLNNGILSSPTWNFTKQTTYPIIMNGGTLQWTMGAGTSSTPLGADSQFFDLTGFTFAGGIGVIEIADGAVANLDTQDNNVNFGNVFGYAPNGTVNGGSISTGGINKLGTGTLFLNTSPYYPSNTNELYTGGTTVTQGTLSFSTGVLNGTGPITMNGGSLQWSNLQGTNSTDVSGQLVMVNGIPATLDMNGNTVNFASSIGSSSSASLVLVGSGFLTLQAPSTYTGTTTVSSGTLEAAIPAALPNYATSGSVTVGSGATVAVMTGGSAGWSSGQIDGLRAAAVWTDNTSTLGIDTTNGNFVYASVIDQPLSLNKMGANTLTLTATSTYTGATSVTGGTLQVGTPNALPTTTAVTLANTAGVVMDLHGFGQMIGSLSGGGPNGGNVTLGGGTLTVGGGGSSTYSGSISGNGALVVQGPGTFALTASHSYTGPTIINSGTLMLQPANSLFFSAPLAYTFANGAVNNGTQSVTSPTSGSPTFTPLGGPAPGLGYVTLNGSQYIEIDPNSGNLPNLSGSANYTIAMWIQTTTPGSEFLYKGSPAAWDAGAEAFYLSGATGNTGGGAGNVIGGVQSTGGWVGGSTSVDTGNWTHIAIVRNGGTDTFYVNGVADPVTATNMNVGEDGTQMIRIGWTNDPFDGPANFVGSISGVTVFGSALSSAQVQGLMQPSGSNLLPVATPVTIAAGGTLDLGGAYQQLASLSDAAPGGGGVINSNQALSSVLVLSPSSGSTTFSGQIEGGGALGMLALVMSGNGVQVLSGTNTYTGGTFVLDGTLVVTSDEGLLDGSSLTVGNPAAFFGTLAPADAAAGAAAIAPVPEPGTLALIAAGGAVIMSRHFRRRRSRVRKQ